VCPTALKCTPTEIDLELKKIVHLVRMEEEVENDIEFSQDIFQKSIDMLKKKTGHKYDFILKSGESCGLDIWELALIPSLTNNCGTWTQILQQSVEKLDKLQNLFLQILFAVGQSCPRPALPS
jgi:hypothetical protein